MMTKLFVWWFHFKGWKIEGEMPKNISQCVIIGAPHTSNWDFVYAMAALRIIQVKPNYLAKKQLFWWPLSLLLKKTGGIAVDRSKSHNLVESIFTLFQSHEKLLMLFPAEGTRSAVKKWKTGFYWVALKAGVPVYMAYLDYGKRRAGIGPRLDVTGDIQADFKKIKAFYSGIQPCVEKNFNRNGIRPD